MFQTDLKSTNKESKKEKRGFKEFFHCMLDSFLLNSQWKQQ